MKTLSISQTGTHRTIEMTAAEIPAGFIFQFRPYVGSTQQWETRKNADGTFQHRQGYAAPWFPMVIADNQPVVISGVPV